MIPIIESLSRLVNQRVADPESVGQVAVVLEMSGDHARLPRSDARHGRNASLRGRRW
jgi:hypothetical protein